MSSPYKKLEERVNILTDANTHLRKQLDATMKVLAGRDELIATLEVEVIKAHAEIAQLKHKLEAKQMHLDAMTHPETAKVWHEIYIKEILK